MQNKFIHRQNEKVFTTDGRTLHISRACSVVAEVCLYDIETKDWYILLMQRGEESPDFKGFWCLPCGYLDWDETLYQAMLREVYEETGLLVSELINHPQFMSANKSELAYLSQPWLIYDLPEDKKQNLAFHFATLFSWKGLPYPTLNKFNEQEVTDVKWFSIKEAMTLTLAFNHQQRIQQLWHEKKAWFEQIEGG